MKDQLCACHEVAVAEASESESKSDLSPPSIRSLLDNRPTERYVPKSVTCTNCGEPAASFSWFQRVPAGDVAEGTPESDLYFCDIVCVSWYTSEQFDDYDPELLNHSVSY
jgi:C1A family cysteine protease